jgi:hypothetical protein
MQGKRGGRENHKYTVPTSGIRKRNHSCLQAMVELCEHGDKFELNLLQYFLHHFDCVRTDLLAYA